MRPGVPTKTSNGWIPSRTRLRCSYDPSPARGRRGEGGKGGLEGFRCRASLCTACHCWLWLANNKLARVAYTAEEKAVGVEEVEKMKLRMRKQIWALEQLKLGLFGVADSRAPS